MGRRNVSARQPGASGGAGGQSLSPVAVLGERPGARGGSRRTSKNGRPSRRWYGAGLGIFVAIAIVAGLIAWPYGDFSAPVMVVVPAHSSRWSIAQHLAHAGVVRSAGLFAAWALAHPGSTLKAGNYRFAHPASMPAVFTQLVQGRTYTWALVVPEGFNRFDIARELRRKHLASAAAFLVVTASPVLVQSLDPQAVSLEGYLFPATYALPPHISAQAIAARMVQRFRREMPAAGWHPGLRDPHGRLISLHEWVTVASLVEKETAAPRERAIIAGVFYNRIDQRLPLQSDPTVLYAAEVAGQPTGAITSADLHLLSPYNTYTHAGLPPGPIANPGQAALWAASHAAATPYLYFVSDGHGAHRFARTLAGQDRNIRLYLQAQAASNGGD